MSELTKIAANNIPLEREGRVDRPSLLARRRQDQVAGKLFFIFSLIPISLAVFIMIMLVVRAWPIFQAYSWWDMLTGQVWNPEKGLFGFMPFIAGTVWVTAAGLILAVPPCLLTAVY